MNPHVTGDWVAEAQLARPHGVDAYDGVAAAVNGHVDAVLADPQALAAAVSSEVLVAALTTGGGWTRQWEGDSWPDYVARNHRWVLTGPWRPVESTGGA